MGGGSGGWHWHRRGLRGVEARQPVIAAVLVLTGRSLDPATVIVFNVCLGLAVDDTVHVMAALARNRREGVSIASAMRRAIVETGNPVVLGGLVLGVGFAAVTVSSVPSLAGFGRLACAAIAAAALNLYFPLLSGKFRPWEI